MLLGVSGGRGPPAPPLVGGAGGSGAAAAATPSATWTPARGRTQRWRTATTVQEGGMITKVSLTVIGWDDYQGFSNSYRVV